jgi:(2Fe-2S) ferredoxin
MLIEELKRAIPEQDYQLTSTGCLGSCALGPTLFVHPDGILYGRVKLEDVHEIVEQHLVAGRPVTRLVVNDDAP